MKRLRVDALKVDRSFVGGLGHDPEDSAIVAAVVSLAHALGLSAVAEGVETEEQLEHLRRLDCDLAQGNYFAPPRPPEALGGTFGLQAAPASALARQRLLALGPTDRLETGLHASSTGSSGVDGLADSGSPSASNR